jgi:uncharacterized protein YheU (UPF0270 family)
MTPQPPIRIPPDRLSPDVLDRLVEEFVTRHGTDLAEADAKKAQVHRQLRTGQAVIVFDEQSQTANIVEKGYKPTPLPKDARRQIVYEEPAPPDPTE